MLLLSGCSGQGTCTAVPSATSGGTEEPTPPDSKDTTTLFLIGDWGTGGKRQRRVARMLERQFDELSKTRRRAPFIVTLGDNLYASNSSFRGQKRRDRFLEEVDRVFGDVYRPVKFRGRGVIFHLTPGNHDHRGDVLHQEVYAEGRYDGSNPDDPVWKYYPMHVNGVDDSNDDAEYNGLNAVSLFRSTRPQLLQIVDGPVAIAALDTQLLLKMYDEGRSREITEHWKALENVFSAKNDVPWKMIVAHHPIASHGPHGERWGPIDWLEYYFHGKSRQRVVHPANRRLAKDLRDFMKRNGVRFYAAGHDHNLQLLDLDDGLLQIVSGAAGKPTYAKACDDTLFAAGGIGFVRVDATARDLSLRYVYRDDSGTKMRSFSWRVGEASATK